MTTLLRKMNRVLSRSRAEVEQALGGSKRAIRKFPHIRSNTFAEAHGGKSIVVGGRVPVKSLPDADLARIHTGRIPENRGQTGCLPIFAKIGKQPV